MYKPFTENVFRFPHKALAFLLDILQASFWTQINQQALALDTQVAHNEKAVLCKNKTNKQNKIP